MASEEVHQALLIDDQDDPIADRFQGAGEWLILVHRFDFPNEHTGRKLLVLLVKIQKMNRYT